MYLTLGIAAVTSANTALVTAAHATMDWAGWVVLVPLALASLLTGIAQALTTSRGCGGTTG